MGEYDYKPGGSLKFKGGGEKKKKKKSSTSEGVRALESTSDKRTDAVVTSDSAQARREGSAASASGSGREYERLDSPSTTSVQQGGSGSGTTSKADTSLLTKHSSTHAQSHMTESERRYDEVRRRRLADKVRKEARKSHKDRVQEFNEKLGKLSEHHDLPRIGPG